MKILKLKNGKQETFPIQFPSATPKEGEEEQETAQFLTRFYSNQLVTERVVREGSGYATTQREKDVADEKQKRNEEKMNKMLSKAFSMKSKTSSSNPKPALKDEDLPQQESVKPPTSLFSSITSFNKKGLKATQTVEKHLPTVNMGKSYGHSTDEEIKEYYDDEQTLDFKIKRLAELIRDSKHNVIFTGAGISTSAKIPDYRGPKGVWTLRDRGEAPKFEITLQQALPTVPILLHHLYSFVN